MAPKFSVIGTGPWGRTVAAKVQKLGFECETCSARANVQEWEELILRNDITWVAAHPDVNCEIAGFSIRNRRPVVVEKPVALTGKSVEALVKASAKYFVPLIVNYIHLFNPDLLKLRQSGIHTLSVAVGGNSPERDYSALWDYGSHAIAIALDFIRKPLTSIEALCFGEGYRLHFGNAQADVMASNKWPDKLVQCICIGDNGEMAWRDDRSQDPLAALIGKVVGLHESGEFWSNGDLAVMVTMLLERLHR
jgi:predicted dehydrogenase